MADLELQSQETVALLKTSERPKKRALAVQLVALCGAAALAGAALASRAGPRDVAVTGLARTNETLPAKPAANESVPVEVPDLKLTTPGFGVQGCGCSVQTCCDAINAIWQKRRPGLMTSLPDSWISHASCSRSSFPSRGARSRRRRMRTRRGGWLSLEIS